MTRTEVADILAALLYAGFVVLGLLFAGAPGVRERERSRRRISVFIGFALLASFAPGLRQRSLWPFSTWHLIAMQMQPVLTYPRVIVVDSLGTEYDVDYRAFEPLVFMEIRHWLWSDMPRLPPDQQRVAARYLLDLANASRQRALAGRRVGTRDRWLGPLAAPGFLLHPGTWSDPARIPARPFVALRVYTYMWHLEARARGDMRMQRRLLYDSGRSP